MGIHTPIDNHFRFGELYGIRKSYRDMSRSIQESDIEKKLFDMMMARMVESGNLEKIERFGKKNRRLSEFAAENSIQESISAMKENTKGLNIPQVIKKRASQNFRKTINEIMESTIAEEYYPSFHSNRHSREIYIFESDDDNIDSSMTEKESKDIDTLINDIAVKKGILGNNEIIQSKADKEFEDDLDSKNEEYAKKHNYAIHSVILESIAGNEKKSTLIPPTSIYQYGNGNSKEYLDTTIKSVINGINAICGLNFPESDCIWLSSGRPVPFLKSEMAVTSDMVKGNRLLNAYFGPAGEFKDYLYRADGTPRIDMSKAVSMSTIDKEVNAIMSYPIIRAYSVVVSWDIVNGEEVLRKIGEEDFQGTDIKVVE